MKPKLIFPAVLERKLNAYVQEVDGEIAGMGAVEIRDDGNFYVLDIAIYDQEVTKGTADLSSEALAHFQTDIVKRGLSPRNYYLWWHSHDTMGAFFSTTDTGTIETSTEFDHVLSLVVNKRRDRKCRFDTHRVNNLPMRLVIENIEVVIQQELNPRIMEIDEIIKELEDEKLEIEYTPMEGMEELRAEVAEKVKTKSLGAGFGKQKGDKTYLEEDFDEKWSKKRKKGGTVTTAGEVITSLSIDEIILAINDTREMIKAHEFHGNGDTAECAELREDLHFWYDELAGVYEGEDEGTNELEFYHDGQRYVSRKHDDTQIMIPHGTDD